MTEQSTQGRVRRKAMALISVGGALALSTLAGTALQSAPAADRAFSGVWSSYGGGPEGVRYSHLTQINRTNVGKLEVAWTFDAGEGAGGTQIQPLVAGGSLFIVTPKHNVVALDATTGKQLWRCL